MAFCENCGEKLNTGAKFCEKCGAKIALIDESPIESTKEKKTTRRKAANTVQETSEPIIPQTVGGSGEIKLCADGNYRWIYEFPMLKNPTLLFTVWKVLLIGACGPALLVFLSDISDGFIDAFLTTGKVFLIVGAIMLVLSIIAYLMIVISYGGKYIVLFSMDEEGIVHMQQEKQFKKAQALGWITAMAGATRGRPGVAGSGISIATKSSISSTFSKVKTIKGLRRRNTIKVNQPFAKNQVYVDPRDYDFVFNFITSRCPKAKIK